MKFAHLLAFLLVSMKAVALPNVQVVQSVPLETNLQINGIVETANAWVGLINAAKSTLDIEQFYISSQTGQALDAVLNSIKAAAARGVKVRIMVDAKFYQNYSNDPRMLAQVPNIQVKVIDYSSRGGVQHAKYFVVDQSLAYVGSANFDWLAMSHIHELGLVFSEPTTCAALEMIFNRDWNFAQTSITPTAIEGVQRFFTSPLSVLASPAKDLPAGVPPTIDTLLALINGAKTSVQVQMYQYSTSVYQSAARFTDLEQALKKAAARGVQVQVMVDQATLKNGRADVQSLTSQKNIQVKIITIPQWSGGPLQYARLSHSKYMIIDGVMSWVGSENWSQSYFTQTRNVGILVQDASVTASVAQVFNKVWTSPYVSAPAFR